MFRRVDEGTHAASQATGLAVIIGAVAGRAHEDGVARVRAHQAAVAQARFEADHDAEVANARRLAVALAAERAENARLRRALAQRQAVIEMLQARA